MGRRFQYYFPDLVGLAFGGVLQVHGQGFVRAGWNAEYFLGYGREDVLEHFPENLVVILRHRVKLNNCNANLGSRSPDASSDEQE